MLKIRQYAAKDKEGVVQLLILNTPKYFDKSEKEDLENYLKSEVEDYFVVEENFQIIGAGGINYFPKDKTARISWDIISPNSQGMGIGSKLTRHRINHLNKKSDIDLIVVRTTQLVHEFYGKMGFTLVKIETDFWAEGYDLYQMEQDNKS